MKRFQLLPCDLVSANNFVSLHHRHHGPVIGCKFCLAATMAGEEHIRGVAIVGRPLARGLQDGFTLEVTRMATDGSRDLCSFLYGAAWRATRALGYRRLITYILAIESGISLSASGWRLVAEVKGRSWHCQSRPRLAPPELQDKLRYEVTA